MKILLSLSIFFSVTLISNTAYGASTSENPEDVVTIFIFFKDQIDSQKCGAGFSATQTPFPTQGTEKSLIVHLNSHHIEKRFLLARGFFTRKLYWDPESDSDGIRIQQFSSPVNGDIKTIIEVRLGPVAAAETVMPRNSDDSETKTEKVLGIHVESIGGKIYALDSVLTKEESKLVCIGIRGCSWEWEVQSITNLSTESCLKTVPSAH
jgi:hypothetical protein